MHTKGNLSGLSWLYIVPLYLDVNSRDRHKDGRADRQIDRHTDRQTDRQPNRQEVLQKCRCVGSTEANSRAQYALGQTRYAVGGTTGHGVTEMPHLQM